MTRPPARSDSELQPGSGSPPQDSTAKAIERASLTLSLLMGSALTWSVLARRTEPTAVCGFVGLTAVFLYVAQHDRPRSWWPTLVTCVRVLLTTWLAWTGAGMAGWQVAASVIFVFTLDGLDGYLARRTNSVSALGGFLDGETDAVLTAVVCLLLYLHGPHGVWVMTAGYLRFVYALIVKFVPSQGHVPRSALAARAFGISLVSLVLGYLSLPVLSRVAPVLGTLLLCWSFGRSFYWSFRGSPKTAT